MLMLCVDSDKEERLRQLTACQKQEAEQAQKVLDDFKLHIENNSAKMYRDMKTQVGHWQIPGGELVLVLRHEDAGRSMADTRRGVGLGLET